MYTICMQAAFEERKGVLIRDYVLLSGVSLERGPTVVSKVTTSTELDRDWNRNETRERYLEPESDLVQGACRLPGTCWPVGETPSPLGCGQVSLV